MEIIGDPFVLLILWIVFFVFGMLVTLKPELILKWQTYLQKKIMGVKYVPSERTRILMRLIRIAIILFTIYLFRFI